MTTNRSSACNGTFLLLIQLTCVITVLTGPLFCESSIAWAQVDASQQATYRLVGTIEGGPFTGAVIEDAKNPQTFYRLSDKLPDYAQIVKIQHNHIVLKLPDGTKTELYTTPGTGIGTASAASAAPAPTSPRRIDQPAPERSVDPYRDRAAQTRTNPSEDTDKSPASRRPFRMERQKPNEQGDHVRNPNTRKGIGGTGRRSRPRTNDDN